MPVVCVRRAAFVEGPGTGGAHRHSTPAERRVPRQELPYLLLLPMVDVSSEVGIASARFRGTMAARGGHLEGFSGGFSIFPSNYGQRGRSGRVGRPKGRPCIEVVPDLLFPVHAADVDDLLVGAHEDKLQVLVEKTPVGASRRLATTDATARADCRGIAPWRRDREGIAELLNRLPHEMLHRKPVDILLRPQGRSVNGAISIVRERREYDLPPGLAAVHKTHVGGNPVKPLLHGRRMPNFANWSKPMIRTKEKRV